MRRAVLTILVLLLAGCVVNLRRDAHEREQTPGGPTPDSDDGPSVTVKGSPTPSPTPTPKPAVFDFCSELKGARIADDGLCADGRLAQLRKADREVLLEATHEADESRFEIWFSVATPSDFDVVAKMLRTYYFDQLTFRKRYVTSPNEIYESNILPADKNFVSYVYQDDEDPERMIEYVGETRFTPFAGDAATVVRSKLVQQIRTVKEYDQMLIVAPRRTGGTEVFGHVVYLMKNGLDPEAAEAAMKQRWKGHVQRLYENAKGPRQDHH